jgi:hypothetical protein
MKRRTEGSEGSEGKECLFVAAAVRPWRGQGGMAADWRRRTPMKRGRERNEKSEERRLRGCGRKAVARAGRNGRRLAPMNADGEANRR